MVTWRFNGYYSTPHERAREWTWTRSALGCAEVVSIRAFSCFADCVKDAERHGYRHGEHRSEFVRLFDVEGRHVHHRGGRRS